MNSLEKKLKYYEQIYSRDMTKVKIELWKLENSKDDDVPKA
jgi:DNA transposition AAA+ family ATPase